MPKNNRPSKQPAVLHVAMDTNQLISVRFDVPYSASVRVRRLQTFETGDASEVTGQGGVRTVFAPVHMHSP